MRNHHLSSSGRGLLLSVLSLCIFVPVLQAQTRTITGVVQAQEDNSPLAGAVVLVKGTNIGLFTDNSGRFSVNVPDGKDTLIASYLGYRNQFVPIGNQTEITILLEPDEISLDGVVVVGYGVQRKSDLTGAVSSVRGPDLTKLPSLSPEQALQGKIAGLQVASTSGQPGSIPILRVRGVGTLNNAAPIFVVDGVILDDISFLNSNDIESIEVLKDASATAIYGSRGANGVIMVSTKQGTSSQQKPVINVSSDVSFQHLQNKIELLTGQEFAEVVNTINPGTYNNISKVPNTDWQSLLFNQFAPIYNSHASVTGGSESYHYYFGLGHFLQKGIVPTSDYERLSIKFNNTFRLNKQFRVGASITASPDRKQNSADVIAGAYRAWPSLEPYKADGTYAEIFGSGNPLAALEYNNSYTRRMRSVGNLYGELTLFDALTLKSSIGYDWSTVKDETFTPVYYVSAPQSNPLNDYSRTQSTYNSWLWENTANYTKEIGKHRINLLAGFTAQKNQAEIFGANIQNLISEDPSMWYLNSGEFSFLNANQTGDITTLASYLFRANYSFNDRFIFTGTYRFDGSSKFSKDNRWGAFPSLAAGWRINNEAFMKQFTAVSNLKLRASWGIIGNEKIAWSRRFSLIDNNTNAVFGTNEELAQGATYSVLGNPNLKWENTMQTDIGLEFGLWGDALTGEIDVYRKITDGILVDLLSPGHMGNGPFTKITYNAAKVMNQGLEYNLSYRGEAGRWRYKIGTLGSFIKNEVQKLGATAGEGSYIPSGGLGNGQLVSRTVVGQPIGSFYGYQVIGVLQTQEEVNSSAIVSGQQPGDLKFADLNGDGVIDDKDRTFIGSYIPNFLFGISGDVSYNNWSLSLDFNGQAGNKIYNGKEAVRPDLYNFEAHVKDHWAGAGSSDSEPRPTVGGPNYDASEYFIQSASFFRLRSATLNYAIPVSGMGLGNIREAKVYARGTNLFTLSKYTGYTPEISSKDAIASGIDLGVYPITSVYTIGIDITF